MDYLSVTNLETYQHYKDRHMVWFKWHIDCLQDSKFIELSPNDRWVFIGLICLACKCQNKIEFNVGYIERTLNIKNVKESIATLTDNKLLSIRYQNAIPIREDKIREDNTDSIELSQNENSKPIEVVATFQTNGRIKCWELTKTFYDEMKECYPAVDLDLQIRAMKGWVIANPTKRKTANGMPKFINAWLNKEQNQNKGGNFNDRIPRNASVGNPDDYEKYNHTTIKTD